MKKAMQKPPYLLINEQPLQVLPELAVLIGLNEAIVLQQVARMTQESGEAFGGHLWVRTTLNEWGKLFPFWSLKTTWRTLQSLRAKGLLLAETHDDVPTDRALWYATDDSAIEALMSGTAEVAKLSS